MIDRTHELPVVRQCQALSLARSTAYYRRQETCEADLALMRQIDALHLEHPFAGSRMLAWRLSNTLTTDFCLEAVQEAIHRHGTPEIFNTDQGSQFTSVEFTDLLKDNGIAISMDGRGQWRDNVFVERLWKSIKYEEVYLHAYETVSAAKSGIGRYLEFYNGRRPHSALDGMTPHGFYYRHLPVLEQAA